MNTEFNNFALTDFKRRQWQINLINDTATKFYLLNFVIFINFAGGEYARFLKLSPSAYKP